MTRARKPSLLHRGYLYAQKHVANPAMLARAVGIEPHAMRMRFAKIWRDGYLQAQRDARKTR